MAAAAMAAASAASARLPLRERVLLGGAPAGLRPRALLVFFFLLLLPLLLLGAAAAPAEAAAAEEAEAAAEESARGRERLRVRTMAGAGFKGEIGPASESSVRWQG
jgi:hypothetical protein